MSALVVLSSPRLFVVAQLRQLRMTNRSDYAGAANRDKEHTTDLTQDLDRSSVSSWMSRMFSVLQSLDWEEQKRRCVHERSWIMSSQTFQKLLRILLAILSWPRRIMTLRWDLSIHVYVFLMHNRPSHRVGYSLHEDRSISSYLISHIDLSFKSSTRARIFGQSQNGA